MRSCALLVIAGATLLGACGAKTASLPGVVLEHVAETARRGVAIVTDDNETNREAARALAAPLAAECSAEALGVGGSVDSVLARARARGVAGLVTCRVIEYDPYDPQRLVVRVTFARAGGASRMSAEQAMALGRGVGGAALRPYARPRLLEKTVRIDLGTRRKSWMLAYAAELGLGESPEDLLEAEILLRDPARFFPFAAHHIARQVPTGRAKPTPGPSETPRAAAPVSRPAPDSHVLGRLGELR